MPFSLSPLHSGSNTRIPYKGLHTLITYNSTPPSIFPSRRPFIPSDSSSNLYDGLICLFKRPHLKVKNSDSQSQSKTAVLKSQPLGRDPAGYPDDIPGVAWVLQKFVNEVVTIYV